MNKKQNILMIITICVTCILNCNNSQTGVCASELSCHTVEYSNEDAACRDDETLYTDKTCEELGYTEPYGDVWVRPANPESESVVCVTNDGKMCYPDTYYCKTHVNMTDYYNTTCEELGYTCQDNSCILASCGDACTSDSDCHPSASCFDLQGVGWYCAPSECATCFANNKSCDADIVVGCSFNSCY